jgi:hypothetical protein
MKEMRQAMSVDLELASAKARCNKGMRRLITPVTMEDGEWREFFFDFSYHDDDTMHSFDKCRLSA